MTTAERGTCPWCGASVALRKDGTLRIHQDRAAMPSRINGARVYPHCHGSDQVPSKVDGA